MKGRHTTRTTHEPSETGGKTREPKDTDHLLTLLTCLSRLFASLGSCHVRFSLRSSRPYHSPREASPAGRDERRVTGTRWEGGKSGATVGLWGSLCSPLRLPFAALSLILSASTLFTSSSSPRLSLERRSRRRMSERRETRK